MRGDKVHLISALFLSRQVGSLYLEFTQILRAVRAEVWNKTNGTQRPGEYNQLINEIYLKN